MPKALITGITGQDGSYLAELLLEKGYAVHGMLRRNSTFTTGRIEHVWDRLRLHYGDMTDASSIGRIVAESEPDEVYNLAAQSHVAVSWQCPEYTMDTIAMGTLRLLEALRGRDVRVYQASSSEMFGNGPAPQSEATPFAPCSPYAVAKVAAHQMAQHYRHAHGMYVACGILFNHESPRRGETFVTRKICRAAARINAGLQDTLELGNPEARRDWGHAADYVQAMWLMLQHDRPDDYVVATGESHSVSEACEVAFNHVGLDWRKYVRHNPKYDRPLDVDHLLGDATKVRSRLGWVATVGFEQLIRSMTEEECNGIEHVHRERPG